MGGPELPADRVSLDESLARDLQSKPWSAFLRQNPGIGPLVEAYLAGGPRPDVSRLEPNHYAVARVLAEDERRKTATPPPPPPPSGDKLRYAPPALSNPVNITLTNANRTSALSSGQGRDARVSVAEVLTGGGGQVSGWRNLVWLGGEFQTSGNPSSSGHIVPINNSGTLHFEGIKARVSGDFFGARFTNPVIQIQNCDIQVSDEGSSAHADAFQTQYLTCDSLRVDRCTIRTDYQGFFCSNEPQYAGQPSPSRLDEFRLSRTNFRPGPQGYPATFVFKAIPSKTSIPLGPWYLDDVWIPDDNPTMRVYPSSSGTDWAGNPLATKCSRVGNTVVWTSDAGISGVLTIGTPADFAAGAGMSYVPPGYA